MKFLIPSLLLALANNVAGEGNIPTPINQLLQEELGSLAPKIVDGTEVNPKFKYPYMVYAGGCGASLVAPNVLLSAAHCFNAINSVQIGRHNLLDNSENYESFSIVEKVPHPNYDSGTLDYDFMMLRMSGSSSRTPVVLDDGSVLLDAGRDVIPMGWGTTSSGGAGSNVLLEAEVDLYSKAQCQSAYGASSITDRMVCAARPGRDSCQGDSGGPMIDKATGKQVGVVSWGYGCALAQYPGVYAKVQNQIDWIEQYIDQWSDGPSPPTSPPPPTPPTPPPTPAPTPPPGDCTDVSDWTDIFGDGCEWYETNDSKDCPNYGDLWANDDKTANDACCYCGGGNTGPAPPTPPPTPQPTPAPTPSPTPQPTPSPTPAPTPLPTPQPTPSPTPSPTPAPTPPPTPQPTPSPTPPPTPGPTPPPGDCTDISGWTDFYGDGCEWYETNDTEGCPNYGDLWANDDKTPNEACCHCGGGNTGPAPPTPAPTPPPTPPPGDCTDVSDWTDSFGDGCEWYETNDSEDCPNYGDFFANDGKTPNEACCHCGGGIP